MEDTDQIFPFRLDEDACILFSMLLFFTRDHAAHTENYNGMSLEARYKFVKKTPYIDMEKATAHAKIPAVIYFMPDLADMKHHIQRSYTRLLTWYSGDENKPPIFPLSGFHALKKNCATWS